MRLTKEEKARRLEAIHDLAKARGRVDYGEVARLLDLGPSAAIMWCKLATRFYLDLRYGHGVLAYVAPEVTRK
jgi:Mn-dependent DtxR family transcriptional regulator